MLQMYGSLLGIYAIPNLDNYRSTYNIHSGSMELYYLRPEGILQGWQI